MFRPQAAILVGASTLLCTAPGLARGPESTARLVYEQGAGAGHCPDAAAIRNAVAARLGYVPWREPAERTVRVRLAGDHGVLRAQVELLGGAGDVLGQRQYVSRRNDCEELSAALAFGISMALDPFSGGRAARPGHGSGSRLAAPPADLPTEDPKVGGDAAGLAPDGPGAAGSTSAGRPAATRSRLPDHPAGGRARAQGGGEDAPGTGCFAGLGAVVALASAPAPTLGVSATAGIRRGSLSIALEGRVDGGADEAVPGGTVSSMLLVASVVPCAQGRWAQGCVIVAAGGLEAAGHGLRDASTSWEPWGAIGMRAGALIPLARHLAFRSHMDWLVALSRIRLQDTVTGEPFWEVPPLSLAFGAGMLGVFP